MSEPAIDEVLNRIYIGLIVLNCIFCVLMILTGKYEIAAINFLAVVALLLTVRKLK